MTAFPDLEIGLHRQDVDGYAMEMRFSQPTNEADIRLTSLVQFDMEGLRALALDAAEYGRLLGQSLFADPAVQTLLAQARSQAQTQLARSMPSIDGITLRAGITAQLVVAMTNSPIWLRNGTRSHWK